MKEFGISSLLWNKSLEDKVLPILNKYNINLLEIAPYRLWSTWQPHKKEIDTYLEKLNEYNLSISSIQGITFSNMISHNDMLIKNKEYWDYHFDKVLKLLINLDCPKAILGAPLIRNDFEFYSEFLKRYNELYFKFLKFNKYILLEAVPKYYGSLIINNLTDLKILCEKNNYKFHFDTGCFLNEENHDYDLKFNNLGDSIKEAFHVHISNRNPKLMNIDQEVYDLFKDFKYLSSKVVIFENLSQSNSLSEIENLLSEIKKFVKNI